LEEETRLKSLGNVINMAGYSQFIWEDFADEIYSLLRKCMSASSANSEAFLLEHFNNEEVQNQIITYLKVRCTVVQVERPRTNSTRLSPQLG
jgi:ubiquitin thioesterase protein OTUB1